ncbi:hypothetical protein I3F58_01910 [Streptomyces sp. MUM 203J]|uniref:hypothetical protein n=1 Tax=Streptomyces sp. MUM 203J TaxID=2791990 RepID=UPI001F041A95|nr:hypothetical protein [Streptomyces sp. MUM 203J]MCH0538336.1 hypothetical protein [Streptomyces sp. MUM 203J]
MRSAVVILALLGGSVVGAPGVALAADGCKNEKKTSGSVDGRELVYDSSTSCGTQFGAARDEIGHALKMGHFDDRRALMHCSDNRTVHTPQSKDKKKYKEIWR